MRWTDSVGFSTASALPFSLHVAEGERGWSWSASSKLAAKAGAAKSKTSAQTRAEAWAREKLAAYAAGWEQNVGFISRRFGVLRLLADEAGHWAVRDEGGIILDSGPSLSESRGRKAAEERAREMGYSDVAQSYGSELKRLRLAAGLTQTEIARLLSVSVVYISNSENDLRAPMTSSRHETLALVLDTTARELDELARVERIIRDLLLVDAPTLAAALRQLERRKTRLGLGTTERASASHPAR